MAELVLVRHGHTDLSSGNYDQLSPLGERQAFWLGEYFAQRRIEFDRVVIGTLQRHQQTADAILRGMRADLPCEQDCDLNEYDFFALLRSAGREHEDVLPSPAATRKEHYKALKRALILWSQDRIGDGVPETWQQFTQRVARSRERFQSGGGKRVLAVSSGGVIGVFAQQVLQASDRTAIELNMQTRNCSFGQYFFGTDFCLLASLNNIPHLDHPDRLDTITYG